MNASYSAIYSLIAASRSSMSQSHPYVRGVGGGRGRNRKQHCNPVNNICSTKCSKENRSRNTLGRCSRVGLGGALLSMARILLGGSDVRAEMEQPYEVLKREHSREKPSAKDLKQKQSQVAEG